MHTPCVWKEKIINQEWEVLFEDFIVAVIIWGLLPFLPAFNDPQTDCF